jgi:hypothetical protein
MPEFFAGGLFEIRRQQANNALNGRMGDLGSDAKLICRR